MRQSKSLGSLATQSVGGAKKRAAAAAKEAPEREWPATADAYELLEDCGRGVSAVVWQARCLANGDLVAVKILNLDTLDSSLESVMHEALLQKAYRNDSILPLYVSFVHDTQLWMVMPYMEGGSVAHIMRYRYRDGLEEVAIATIMKQVFTALAYIHARGDIHRDVKAGNILIDGAGHVKLGDFGVAASTRDRDDDGWGGSKKVCRTFAGTPCWMAPEVLGGAVCYDASADIWSCGITMLEMAHGHAPFSKYPPMKVLLQTLQGEPPQLEAQCGGRHFSRGMREVVASCLNKDPAKRPTAKQLLTKGFFKQARDADYIRRTLLAGLPPLPQRVMEIRMGKAATLARENDRAAVASHIQYITDVAQWDFNCTRTQCGEAGGRDSSGAGGPDAAAAADHPAGGAGGVASAAAAAGGSADAGTSGGSGGRGDQLGQQQQQQQQGVVAGTSPLGSSHSLDAPGSQQQQQQQQQQHGVVGLDAQHQQAAGDVGPGARDTDAGVGVGGMPSGASLLTNLHGAGSPAAGSPVPPGLADAERSSSGRLITCYAGGKRLAAFPVSVPDTPDHSPTPSRPGTPDPHAAAGGEPAAPAAPGALPAGAKQHGRFVFVEGPSRYQGPELLPALPLSDSAVAGAAHARDGHAAAAAAHAISKQRSISSPDMGLLAALQARRSSAGSDAPLAPVAPLSPRAPAPAVAGSGQATSPRAPATKDAHQQQQPQQQQQQQQQAAAVAACDAVSAAPAAAASATPAAAASTAPLAVPGAAASAAASAAPPAATPGTAAAAAPPAAMASSPSSGGLLSRLKPHRSPPGGSADGRPLSPPSPARGQQQQQQQHPQHPLQHKIAGFFSHHGIGKGAAGAPPRARRPSPAATRRRRPAAPRAARLRARPRPSRTSTRSPAGARPATR